MNELFDDIEEKYSNEYVGMPEFHMERLTPFKSLLVHFNDEKSLMEFAKLIDQKIKKTTPYIYYPKQTLHNTIKYRCIDEP